MWPRLRVQLVLYFVCLVLASCAMVASSAQGDEEASSASVGMAVHVLQGTMMVSEVLSLCNEGLQLVREGSTIYFSGPWNLVDVSASVSLLAGGVGHFTAHMSSVRTIGALGVTLKWLGFVDYLRCFEKTGSLVRIVLVRMHVLSAFLCRLSSDASAVSCRAGDRSRHGALPHPPRHHHRRLHVLLRHLQPVELRVRIQRGESRRALASVHGVPCVDGQSDRRVGDG